MSKALKKLGAFILFVICALIALTALIFLPLFIANRLSPKGTIFYTTGPMFNIIFLFEGIVLAAVFLFSFSGKSKGQDQNKFKKYLKKFWYVPVILVIIGEYLIATDITYVCENRFVKTSAFNIKGKEYSYSDVVNIEAGIHSKGMYKKGSFYYTIEFKDGKKSELVSSGSTNDDTIANYDTYKEIEFVDTKLVALNINKKSDTSSIKYCDYDKKYIDIITGILNNK